MSAVQIPSVGRSVHYVERDWANDQPGATFCRHAVITEVDQGGAEDVVDAVGLAVLSPSALTFNRHVPYDEQKTPGSWHWPEQVG